MFMQVKVYANTSFNSKLSRNPAPTDTQATAVQIGYPGAWLWAIGLTLTYWGKDIFPQYVSTQEPGFGP